MKFSGEIKFPEIDHPGVPVQFVIEGRQAELVVEGESLGRWSLYDVHARRLVASAFQIDLDGTEITFVADDPIDFAYRGVEHMAETWAGIKSKQMGRRMVTVRQSRKGTIASRIDELRAAMEANLEVQSRPLAGEPVLGVAGQPETEAVVEQVQGDWDRRDGDAAIPLVGEQDVGTTPGPPPEEPAAAHLEARVAEELARLDEERRRIAEERARIEAERLEAEQRETVRIEAFRLEMQRLEAEREELRTQAALAAERAEEIAAARAASPEEPAAPVPDIQEAAAPVPAIDEDEAASDSAAPEEAVPEEAVPEEAVPEEAAPEEAAPEEAAPEEAAPEEEWSAPEEPQPHSATEQPEPVTGEVAEPGPGEEEPGGPTGRHVVDLSDLEEGGDPPEPDDAPVPTTPPQTQAALTGVAPTRERGLRGAVRAAFARGGREHEHEFIEAPGGIGITRYVCEVCGYVSISVED